MAHRFTQVADSPDFEGAGGLGGVQLDVDGGPGHLGESQTLPQGGGHVERSGLLHGAVGLHSKRNDRPQHDVRRI